MAYTKNPHLPKVRGEAIQLIRAGWSTRKVAERLGWSQSAVSQWMRRAGPGWYGPFPTMSSRPRKSPRALSVKIVSAIIKERLGKRRCGQVIHQELLKDGVVVSLSSVQRTLKRCHLLKERSPWKRPHDYTERPKPSFAGALVEADTVHLRRSDGGKLYAYTLIDLFSRWAYAEVSKHITMVDSVEFMLRAQKQAPFPFRMVQTDNGGEFQKMFRYRLAKRGILQRYIRVRQKDDNAHIERFNRTVQEECTDGVPKTLRSLAPALKKYLAYYNGERLHMGINFRTPNELLLSTRS